MTLLNKIKKYSWIVKSLLHLPWSVKKDALTTLLTAHKKYLPDTEPQADVEKILKCALCPNMCRFDCPVLECVKSETTSPAGKARIAYLYEMDRFKSRDAVDLMYACAGCGACLQWCPFGFCVEDLLQGVRRDIVDENQYILPSLEELRETLITYHTTFEQGCTSLQREYGEGDTLYFAGCIALNQTKEIPAAVLTILEKAGIEYATLSEEWCCGAPLFMAGFFNDFTAFARHNKEVLSPFNRIVCSCPTCVYLFREIYPSIGVTLTTPVLHITEFLLDCVSKGLLRMKEHKKDSPYVYHDPCILSRRLDILKAPRTLLTSIPGIRLHEPQFSGKETRCCGMGGLLSVTHPSLSFEMGKNRLSQLEKKATHIITECPACKVSFTRVGAAHVTDISEVIFESVKD